MVKDWKRISDDELLNYNDANTAQMARYERIMRHKEIVALYLVTHSLYEMITVVQRSTAGLADNINKAAEKQRRGQKIGIALTVVIAIATIAYTGTTWLSVQAQREANAIQRELLSSPNAAPPKENVSPKL